MSAALDFLAEHATLLAGGATACLAVGLLGVFAAREPIHKQRLSELTVAAAVVWLLLAVAPLPRSARNPASNDESLVSSFDFRTTLPLGKEEPSTPVRIDRPAVESAAVPLTAPAKFSDMTRTPQATVSLPDPPSPPAKSSFGRSVAIGYAASALLALLALVVARLRLWLLIQRSGTPDPATRNVWLRLHPPTNARLFAGPRQSPPLSFGVLKPTVVVPAPMVEQGGQPLEAVLRHELAHIRHRDALSRLLFNTALPLLALHPLYWLLRAKAMFAAELRADAAAAQSESAERYVESLVNLFQTGGRPGRLLAASTVWASESSFSRRMTMLLTRQRPVAQQTCWTWRALATGLIAAAVAGSTSQFGVVYAQTKKEGKSNDALIATITPTSEGAKSADPLVVKFVDMSDLLKSVLSVDGQSLKTTIDLTDGNSSSDLLGAAQSQPTSDPFSADSRARRNGDPMNAAFDAISVQIADRRAKLASARFLPAGEPPFQALRLELEIMALEGYKRSLEFERDLREVEQRIDRATGELDRTAINNGGEHPRIKELQHEIAALSDRKAQLRKMLEEDRVQTEHAIRARAKQEVRTPDDVAEVPSAVATKKGPPSASDGTISNLRLQLAEMVRTLGPDHPAVKSKQSQIAMLEKADGERKEGQAKVPDAKPTTPTKRALSRGGNPDDADMKDLQGKLINAQNQIAQLRDENADLGRRLSAATKSAENVAEFLRANPANSLSAPSLETSAPYLRHRLRVAEAEPELLEKQLAFHKSQLQRLEALRGNGAVSSEEVANAEMQCAAAQAELRKAQTEIQSLRILLQELGEHATRASKPGSTSQAK